MDRFSSPVRSESGTRKHRLRRLVEFGGIRRQPFSQYQSSVRRLYDGPRGAVLKFSSMISLHEPLVGSLFKQGKFDASRFQRILDIGSGAGQVLRHLLRTTDSSAEIVAYDLSWEMLRRGRARMNSTRPAFVAGDMQHLPFADESFDCVTCGWTLEYLTEAEPGLREFQRVLKPGGSVLLLVTEASLTGVLTSHAWKCRTYNRSELKAACETIGLHWSNELYLSPLHRALRIGGILVEATKATPAGAGPSAMPSRSITELAVAAAEA